MHSTATLPAIATTTANSQLADLSTQPIQVHTLQRKARYHDRNRWYLKPLKDAVLLETGCKSTAEIKEYLRMLGVSLDLRLTSAWKAIKFELERAILAVKAVRKALEPETKPRIPTNEERLEQAVVSGAIARWEEDEEGGLYWVWETTDSERELVTGSWLGEWLHEKGRSLGGRECPSDRL